MINGQHWIYNDVFEMIVLALTFVFVYLSIIKPYILSRTNVMSFYMASLGLLLLGVHHIIEAFSVPVVVSGGLLVACAHIYKLAFSERHQVETDIEKT
jgi:hypothetical protein